MKKIILSAVFAIAMFAVNAQTKVTKTSVVGKWSLVAMNIEGTLYFDIDKDSMSLSKAILDQLAASGADSASAVDMMKTQLAGIKELAFTFNADGTASVAGDPKGEETGTYTVDEATETIKFDSKKDGKQDLKASFKNGRLVITMPAGGGPTTKMELKKG